MESFANVACGILSLPELKFRSLAKLPILKRGGEDDELYFAPDSFGYNR